VFFFVGDHRYITVMEWREYTNNNDSKQK